MVGLGDVDVVDVVDDELSGPLVVHVRTRARRRLLCWGRGGLVWSKGTAVVGLVDLLVFGRAVRLVWHKQRWCCPAADCATGSFPETNDEIAAVRSALTTRAGRWAATAVDPLLTRAWCQLMVGVCQRFRVQPSFDSSGGQAVSVRRRLETGLSCCDGKAASD